MSITKKNAVEAATRAGETTASQQLIACFQSIADSIRAKGVAGTMTPSEMGNNIRSIRGVSWEQNPTNLNEVF